MNRLRKMNLDFIASKIRMKKISVHKRFQQWTEKLYRKLTSFITITPIIMLRNQTLSEMAKRGDVTDIHFKMVPSGSTRTYEAPVASVIKEPIIMSCSRALAHIKNRVLELMKL